MMRKWRGWLEVGAYGLWMALSLAVAIPQPALAIKDTLYDTYGIDLTGFVEMRQGWRLQDDPFQQQTAISEGRLQVELAKDLDWAIFQLKGDWVGDLVEAEHRAELRELNATFFPLDNVDVKLGRQTLTWGTGDLLFVNDLFPKDWKSFFIGRDDEYLKAPSDAAKISIFFPMVNLDLIYMPVFNGSTYIDGNRLSYWNPLLERTAGQDFVFQDRERNRFFEDAEYALRLYQTIAGKEVALYAYQGYWQTPEGLDPQREKLIYPRLAVYGASLRLPTFGGIANVESGYYQSRDDRDGDDALVRNSELRFLVGYERELARDLTGGFQYYLEWMMNHEAYEKSAGGSPLRDEYRHVLTLRLTQQLMNQNLTLNLFAYYSPSDEDAYLRPKVHYKLTDAWALETGLNIFMGTNEHTFFGQFKDNTNAYGSVRWHF